MKLSVVLAGSFAINLALLAFYVPRARPDRTTEATDNATAAFPGTLETGLHSAAEKGKNSAAPSTAAHGKDTTWMRLNSGDLQTLAERLRAAGFPPSVVRAVLREQISESFRARREALLPTVEEKPFWNTERGFASSASDQKFYAAVRDLSREQNKLLNEVLGENLDAANEPVSENQRRRYGDLSQEKIDLLQRVEEDYNEMRNEVNLAARGITLPEDRQKFALLEEEKRADLAQILSPSELEDYLMRTSTTTSRLRRALSLLNATESEFRAIYAAQSAFDQKYSYQAVGINLPQELTKERDEAQKQVSAQIKSALGEQRYAEYVRSTDREFQQLNRIALQAGLTDAAAVQAYNVRDSVSKESIRIFGDAALNHDQKRAALQTLAATARTQITAALGPEVGENYLKVAARWIGGLERGSAVTFSETGMLSTRPLPNARPPANAPGNPSAK
jgi:hypothetical protein